MAQKKNRLLHNIASILKDLIISRTDAYAIQSAKGSYSKQVTELVDGKLSEHILGKQTIGIYPLDDENRTKWFCIDIDINGDVVNKLREESKFSFQQVFDRYKSTLVEQARQISWAFESYGYPVYPEFSGSKGFHLWGFIDTALSAEKVIYICKGILDEVEWLNDDLHYELFPKQIEIKKGGYGNVLKLPCGVHQKSKRPSLFIEPDFSDLEFDKALEERITEQLSILYEIQSENKISAEDFEERYEEFKEYYATLDHDKKQATLPPILTITDDRIENIFKCCAAFENMEKESVSKKHLTHGQRLALAFVLLSLGKEGEKRLVKILKNCEDYDPKITYKNIRSITGKYKPYTCKKLAKLFDPDLKQPVCPFNGKCQNIDQVNGKSPVKFAFVKKYEPQVNLSEYIKIHKEQELSKSSELIIREDNLFNAWEKVKNYARYSDAYRGRDSFEEFDRFLFANIRNLRLKLSKLGLQNYRPQPFHKFQLIKENKEERDVVFAEIEDRIVIQAIMNKIGVKFDRLMSSGSVFGHRLIENFESSPFIFKKYGEQYGKYCQAIIHACYQHFKNYYLRLDIRQFYDHVDHTKLLEILAQPGIDKFTVKCIENFLQYKTINPDGSVTDPQIQGLPQGPAYGHFFANVYLRKFDIELKECSLESYRYVDDVFLIFQDKEQATIAEERLSRFLRHELKLGINYAKASEGYIYRDIDNIMDGIYKNTSMFRRDFYTKSTFDRAERVVLEQAIDDVAIPKSIEQIEDTRKYLGAVAALFSELGYEKKAQIKNLMLNNLDKWNFSAYTMKIFFRFLCQYFIDTKEEAIMAFFKKLDNYRIILFLQVLIEFKEQIQEYEDIRVSLEKLLIGYLEFKHYFVQSVVIRTLHRLEMKIDEELWNDLYSQIDCDKYCPGKVEQSHCRQFRGIHFLKCQLMSYLEVFSPDKLKSYIMANFATNCSTELNSVGIAIIERTPKLSDVMEKLLERKIAFVPKQQKAEIEQYHNVRGLIWECYTLLKYLGGRDEGQRRKMFQLLNQISQINDAQYVNETIINLLDEIPTFFAPIENPFWTIDIVLSICLPENLKIIEDEKIRAHFTKYFFFNLPAFQEFNPPQSKVIRSRESAKILGELIGSFSKSKPSLLRLLEDIGSGKYELISAFPSLIQSSKIHQKNNRICYLLKEISTGDFMLYEWFSRENISTVSRLIETQQFGPLLKSLDEKKLIRLADDNYGEETIFEMYGAYLKYMLPGDFESVDKQKEKYDEGRVIELMELIYDAIQPFFIPENWRPDGKSDPNQRDNQIAKKLNPYYNIPTLSPSSLWISNGKLCLVNIGSMFDPHSCFLSMGKQLIHTDQHKPSLPGLFLGLTAFELLTGESAAQELKKIEANRDKLDQVKYLTQSKLLSECSVFFSKWFLKKLTNVVPEYRVQFSYKHPRDFPYRLDTYKEYLNKAKQLDCHCVTNKDKKIVEFYLYMELEAKTICRRVNETNFQKMYAIYKEVILELIEITEFHYLHWDCVDTDNSDKNLTLNYTSRSLLKLSFMLDTLSNKISSIFHTFHDYTLQYILDYFSLAVEMINFVRQFDLMEDFSSHIQNKYISQTKPDKEVPSIIISEDIRYIIDEQFGLYSDMMKNYQGHTGISTYISNAMARNGGLFIPLILICDANGAITTDDKKAQQTSNPIDLPIEDLKTLCDCVSQIEHFAQDHIGVAAIPIQAGVYPGIKEKNTTALQILDKNRPFERIVISATGQFTESQDTWKISSKESSIGQEFKFSPTKDKQNRVIDTHISAIEGDRFTIDYQLDDNNQIKVFTYNLQAYYLYKFNTVFNRVSGELSKKIADVSAQDVSETDLTKKLEYAVQKIELEPLAISYREDYEKLKEKQANIASQSDAELKPTFRKDGEKWTVTFESITKSINDRIGMRYIAYLLGNPGKKFFVADICKAVEGTQVVEGSEYQKMSVEQLREYGLEQTIGDTTETKVDPPTIPSFKKLISDLEEQKSEAEFAYKMEYAEELEEKIKELRKYLSDATDKHGHLRKTYDPFDTLRKKILRNINYSLDKLLKQHRELGLYLKKNISTGRYIEYNPDKPISWQL